MHLRISKYNPEYRDKDGCYLKDDWTGISDIGKSYADGILTAEKYLKVEDSYWSSVKELLLSCCIDGMNIVEIEKYERPLRDIPSELKEASQSIMAEVNTGDLLAIGSIESVFRLTLRECFWCKLTGENGSYLHFGYDYYVYFGSNELSEIPAVDTDPMIYLESFQSPYL